MKVERTEADGEGTALPHKPGGGEDQNGRVKPLESMRVADENGGTVLTPEEAVCLRAANEELRREQKTLTRRLQRLERAGQERLQLTEARVREASAQIEGLKRNAQAVRLRLQRDGRAWRQRAESAESELEQIREEFEQKQLEAIELTTILDATEYRLATIEKDLGAREAELAALQESTAAAVAQAEAEGVRLRQQVVDLEEEQVRARESYESEAQAERQRVEGRLGELERESTAARERYESEVAAAGEARAALEAELEEARSALGELRAQLEVRQEELVAAGRRAEDAAGERDGLREQVEALRRSSAEALSEAQAERQRVEGRLGELEGESAAARERYESEVAAAGEARAALEAELEEARAGRVQVVEELSALRTCNSGLQEQMAAAEERAAAQATELAQVREYCKALEGESQRGAAQCRELEGRFCALREKSEEEGQERERLESLVAEMSQRREDDRATIEHIRGELQEAQAAAATLRTERQAAEESRQAVEAELRAAEASRTAGECDVEALRFEIKRKQAEVTEAELRAAEAEATCDALRERVSGIQGETTRLEEEREVLCAQLEAKAAEVARYEDVAAQLRAREEELVELRGMRDDLTAALDGARQERASLEEEVVKSSVGLEEADSRRSALEAQVAAQQQSEAELRESLANLENQLTAADQQGARAELAQKALTEVLSETESVREELEAVRCDRERVGRELNAQAELLERAQSEAAQSNEQLMAATARARELEERLAILAQEAEARSVEQNSAAQRDLEEREQELASVQRKLVATEDAHHKLTERVTLAEVELAQRTHEVEAWRNKLSQERARQKAVGRGHEELAEECETLRRQHADLQTLVDALENETEKLREETVARATRRDQELAERSSRLEAQVAELDSSLRTADEQRALLENTVTDLQELLDRERAKAAVLKKEREDSAAGNEGLQEALQAARGRAEELEEKFRTDAREKMAALAEAKNRGQALEKECERLAALLGEHDDSRRDRAEEIVQLRVQCQAFQGRLGEVEAERDAMQGQMLHLTALRERLDRECEQLRRRIASAGEVEREKAEMERLKAKIENLEQQHADAVQRHSAAVSGYMLELNQRTELLRQRDIEMQKLQDQLLSEKQAQEDLVSQVASLAEERELTRLKIREMETAPGARPLVDRAAAVAVPTGLAEVAPFERPEPGEAVEEVSEPAVASVADQAVEVAEFQERQATSIIHAEELPPFREAVRSAVEKIERCSYLTLEEADRQETPGSNVLVLNLLTRSGDPLAAVAGVEKFAIDAPRALTYCTDGSRGFVLGMVDFFPEPFDPQGCATRLANRPHGLKRLLTVSDDVEAMSALREGLGQGSRCSISMAFDGRQALDLVPMVKPDLVLVDLALPRGDGLRVVSRLRADPATKNLALALCWGKPLDATDLRHHLLRVVREFTFAPEDLGRAVQQFMNPAIAGEGDVVSRAG